MNIILKKDQNKFILVMLDGITCHPEYFVYTQCKLREGSFDYTQDKSRDSSVLPQNDKRLDIVLAGENASVEIVGLLVAKGEEQKAFETYITHAAPNTKSNVDVRAVLRGKSTFAFRGNVRIEKGAKGADAYLRSDVLLFDDAKMGDDTPALEILEPDVKAGHAATIGKVDAQMLFYLMSRRLTRSQAERLLIEGFVKPVEDILRAKSLGSHPERSEGSRGKLRVVEKFPLRQFSIYSNNMKPSFAEASAGKGGE